MHNIDPYSILARRVAGQTWAMIGASFGCSPGRARRVMVPICHDTSNIGPTLLKAAIEQAVNAKVGEVVTAILLMDELDQVDLGKAS